MSLGKSLNQQMAICMGLWVGIHVGRQEKDWEDVQKMETRSMLHFRVTGEGSPHQTVGNRCASDKRFEKIAVGSPIPGREAGAGEAHLSSRKRRPLVHISLLEGLRTAQRRH